jgi:aryl-phospho-beta-D-glucosidase BglC (GH1 family)
MNNFTMKLNSTLILLLVVFVLSAQDHSNSFEINERLGRGINMGNTFEAPSENEWGNPWKPEYFRIISDLGFSHVRIPIRWLTSERSMETYPYTIYPDFLGRIQEVVDTALMYGLHAVINMHHHEELFEEPDEQKERFISQWAQIAEHFQDYPDSLVFEVLNEPHNNLTAEKWNLFFADALSEIRKTNPQRVVMVGTAEWGGLGGLSKLQLPNDDRLILTIHYYNPFQFTHQGASWSGEHTNDWLGTEWNNTETERQTVMDEFAYAKNFSSEHDIPIHVGEFGAYSTADIDSRVRWTTFLARWFEEQGFSWAYWEFSAGFGIYNPSNGQLLMPLVDALLNNPMPEPVGQNVEPVFEDTFENGSNGWSLQTQGDASASLIEEDSQLRVEISEGGTEIWHIQLVKHGIALEQDVMYRVRFNAAASGFPMSFTTYLGKASDPWNAYSGYNSVTLNDFEYQYSYSFTMAGDSDNNARTVFDLGNSDADFILKYFTLEKITLDHTSVMDYRLSPVRFYPNPASQSLFIKNIDNYTSLTVYNSKGVRKIHRFINEPSIELTIESLPVGLYLVNLSNSKSTSFFRFVKA